ncbi:MAG: HAMP domain-containing histidine kinase [Flavobacteriales bacterium]|jgi:signal transduction histidine kinase|nr:HAMP domain-containing histidine kinase [Flavobacteriales bacterium]MBK7249167.1 HAMP domain-containing histidine kinase [Flavobacteriales bacterium]MBK7285727.1 HAMP domain-containing histidine kinase [Flavobacteriales bacterium]MBK9058597.1 HAMP domain-containing histidine kinase [Flavobacteriales bacterium]MBK9599807.1 HAMP domain-containing histidine kinase [Flavobacteriales bacterium]
MNLYSRKQRWKLVLALVAMTIVGASLWYSSRIVNKVRLEERRKVELWAEAVRNRAQLVNYTDSLFHRLREEERKRVELWADAQVHLASDDVNDLSFYLKVVSDNTTIPVIITDDKGRPTSSHRNLDPGIEDDPDSLLAEVKRMDAVHEPIPITLFGDHKQYLHYTDSRIVTELEQVMDNIIRSFISETVMNTAAVPVIYTDSTRTHVIEHSNIEMETIGDPVKLEARIAAMAQANPPIEVSLAGRGRNYIFYEESRVITQLRYFPYVQLIIIGLFLLVSYALFSLFRNAEQNQVWVGMAKETAHQLGTPLSSLMAWMELMDANGTDPAAVAEMRKDVGRLEMITERFSKIGSTPDLVPEKIDLVLRDTVQYLRPRLPSRVKIEVHTTDPEITVPLNRALFSWVLENLMRNAVDAMEGEGSITITTEKDGNEVHVDVTDTGKGIPARQLRTVFQPGFTTKKRGWGLGLSLTKRIMETYHKGKIFVKRSTVGKGTTFRISLRG